MQLHEDEEYVTIEEFPAYVITTYGRVFNRHTHREMVLSLSKPQGDLSVGLMRDRLQYRLSVKGLVARAFIEGGGQYFNTPVCLDNDRTNLHVSNIVWRPRWFAWRYSRQFIGMPKWYDIGPLMDVFSGEVYRDYLDAAISNGILCVDIRSSIYHNTRCFPTGQIFRHT